jgi:hypothetical protein
MINSQSGIFCFVCKRRLLAITISSHWNLFLLLLLHRLALRLVLSFDGVLCFLLFNGSFIVLNDGGSSLLLRLVALDHGLALVKLILERLKLVLKVLFVLFGLLGLLFGSGSTGKGGSVGHVNLLKFFLQGSHLIAKVLSLFILIGGSHGGSSGSEFGHNASHVDGSASNEVLGSDLSDLSRLVFLVSPFGVSVSGQVVFEGRVKFGLEETSAVGEGKRSINDSLVISHVDSSVDLMLVGVKGPLRKERESLGRRAR